MKMTQLLYFKTVAESGKISSAARKLYVTAPAVSIAIANLEKELGVELFDRSSNRVTLNEQGKIYFEFVNRMFSDLDQAKKAVQAMATTESTLTDSNSVL